MKKKLITVFAATVLALSVFALAGCSNSSSNTNTNSSSSTKTLVVGFDQDYPPYGFVGDDGKYTGFDIDLATMVAQENGWNVELSPIDWNAKDALLNGGNIT